MIIGRVVGTAFSAAAALGLACVVGSDDARDDVVAAGGGKLGTKSGSLYVPYALPD